MPMEFLRQLAHADRFPVVVSDESDIDKLRVLHAAGMVEARLPALPHEPAQIVAITGLGRASLRAQVARRVIELRERLFADKPQIA